MIDNDVNQDLLSCGGLTLDRRRRSVSFNGEIIPLSPTEWRLLEVLIQWPDRVLESSTLISHLWGDEVAQGMVAKKTPLRNCVFKLRSRLESAGCLNPIIENRSHVGYGLVRAKGPS